jgi:UDP-N-acetylglucosamine:LPS N-acetylglucosamine transferase
MSKQGAAVVLDEAELSADANRLAKQLSKLLRDPARQKQLGRHLAKFAKPGAAQALADLILKQAG